MTESKDEHPRKCENWLSDFLKWTIPRSSAKETYIFWTGMFTLSCVLRRHVKVGKEYLGSWEAYPYLYLLFIGPPGNMKTTTTRYNIELLDEVPGLTPAPDQITVPKLASELKDAEECAIYINAGELSEFIAKSGPDMYSFLTKVFDGVKKLSVGTHMRGVELAESPCINFLGASTMETLSEILPQAALDGGFGRRCIFIYEEEARRRKLMYTDVDVKGLYEDYHDKLIHDLKFIANNLYGNFQLTDEAVVKFDKWFVDGAGAQKNKRLYSKMKGYYQTKAEFVMKVAMILKVADGRVIHKDQLVLSWNDLEEAIAVVESVEPNMDNVTKNIGKNPYKSEVKMIYAYIKENSPLLMSRILREFSSVAEPQKLGELVQGLASAGLIIITPDEGDIRIRVK